MKVQLPAKMIFADYSEEMAFKENVKKLIPNLKLKTIGWEAGWLISMAYVGTLKDSDNKSKERELSKTAW